MPPIAAYGDVLAADPGNVAAYKNLGEVLFAAGRVDAGSPTSRGSRRCPDALPLAVQALEALPASRRFRAARALSRRPAPRPLCAATRLELADALEQLLYLLLYFDVEPGDLPHLARNLRRGGAARLRRAAAAARRGGPGGCASAICPAICATT